jgi:DNA-binding winged helix-turn-helix (wHTH) protein/tetratricopeptide (TPR) repeat protein
MQRPDARGYRFGPFLLDREERVLRCEGAGVPLASRPFELLLLFLANPGRTLSKPELMSALWPDVAVQENSLPVAVNAVRRALARDPAGACYVETQPRRGYRFVAPVIPFVARAELAPGVTDADGLVGRVGELARLGECYDAATLGRGQVILISGEAGIGKSALVRQFLRRIEDAPGSAWVGTGDCLQSYGPSEAYLPVLAALAELLSGPGREAIERAIAEHAPSWCWRFPAVLRHLSPAGSAGPGVNPEALLGQLADVLCAASVVKPTLLCFEDIHWADPSSGDLLQLLATRAPRHRLLVLATFRPEEPPPSALGGGPGGASSGAAWAAWATERGLLHLRLPLLSLADTDAYVRESFPHHGYGPELGALVHGKTEGLPLFVTRWIATLREMGLRETGAPSVPAADGTPGQGVEGLERWVPDSLIGLIRHRIERLEPWAQRLLRFASVEGDVFHVAVLSRLLGEGVIRVEEELAQLSRHHWVVAAGEEELPDGVLTARYRFAHILYQNVLHASLGTQRRIELHRLAGEALAAHGAARASRFLPALAVHWEHGRSFPAAIDVLVAAGEHADRAAAPREAMGYFTRARRLLEQLPPDERCARSLILHHGEGWARYCQGQIEAALADFAAMRAHALELEQRSRAPGGERALELAFRHFEQPWQDGTVGRPSPIMPNQPRALGTRALEAEALACTCTVLARAREFGRLRRPALELAGLARATENEPRRAEALALLGVERLERGDLAPARQLLDQSIALSRAIGHERSLRRALSDRGLLHAVQTELPEAQCDYEESSAIAMSAPHLVECLLSLGDIHARQGKISSALELHARAAQRSFWAYSAHLPPLTAWIHHELGDIVGAIEIGCRAVDALRQCRRARNLAMVLGQLALSYVSRGELAQARVAMQHAEAQLEAEDVERVWRIEPLWAAQSGLALALGDLARAHEYGSRWLALATAQRARESVARAHCALARVAAMRADFGASRAHVEAARSALGETATPLSGLRVHALLARVARRCHDAAAVRQALANAQRLAEPIVASITDGRLRAHFQRELERGLSPAAREDAEFMSA